MAFYEKNIITCVEIGTSKICALHGTCDKAGNPVILGFGQTSPEGSVCKSDIVDYQTVTNALEKRSVTQTSPPDAISSGKAFTAF